MNLQGLIPTAISFGVATLVIVLLIVGLFQLNRYLVKRYERGSPREFQRQMIMLAVSLVGLVFAILIIPVGDAMRGQILGLLGILLSATIALSSTTLVGNILAGFMLKSVKAVRPGAYVRIEGHAGRITAMSLLYTEIQTEDRDLTSLPNLFVATNPVSVFRSSGTVLSVEVSLGYEVSRHDVETALIEAANQAGLASPYVQIRTLGDFSVTYRIAGLAEDIEKLISMRRKLRACVLDQLHDAGIEIVSPNFMNTRSLAEDSRAMPPRPARTGSPDVVQEPETAPEDIVFDKAQQAESVERLREQKDAALARIEECEALIKGGKGDDARSEEAIRKELDQQQRKIERLDALIAAAEQRIAKD